MPHPKHYDLKRVQPFENKTFRLYRLRHRFFVRESKGSSAYMQCGINATRTKQS